MTQNKGRAFLLKVKSHEGPMPFSTIAGMRETGFSAAGNSACITGAGIFLGSAAEEQVRGRALDGSEHDYELSYETGDKLHGRFQIQRLAYIGDYNGERNYEITLLGTVSAHTSERTDHE